MTSKTKTPIMSTNSTAGSIIFEGVISPIIAFIFFGIVAALLNAAIPQLPSYFVFVAFPKAVLPVTIICIILRTLSILVIIFGIIHMPFEIISLIRCGAHLTEDGICGRKMPFGSFDFTFDEIVDITLNRSEIIIVTLKDDGKKKNHKLNAIKNAEEFHAACLKAKAAYHASKAEDSAEAPAAE